MKSMTEPHADRTEQPILTQADGYAPKRARWPGLLAVAVLVAAAIGGMVVSGQDDSKRASGSPDRSVQTPSPQPETPNTQPQDDTRLAQPARPDRPAQQ